MHEDALVVTITLLPCLLAMVVIWWGRDPRVEVSHVAGLVLFVGLCLWAAWVTGAILWLVWTK